MLKGVLITTPPKYGLLHDNAEQYFKIKGKAKAGDSSPTNAGIIIGAQEPMLRGHSHQRMSAKMSGTNTSPRRLSHLELGAQAGLVWDQILQLAGTQASVGSTGIPFLHPSDVNTFFACTAGGGLWKTSNGGSSWTNLTTSLSRLGTSDLIVDSSNPNVLYLATGDCDAGDTPSIGVLKSTDGGASWNPTGLVFNDGQYVYIYRLIRHSSNANILLAATSQGIYKTTNALAKVGL